MFHRNGASALTLVIMLTLAGPVLAQQSGKVPTDGNDLLDYCGVVVNLADSPTSPPSTEVRKVLELSGKINWCMGYLQATLDDLSATQINLALIAMAGVTFSGPDEARKYALDSLRFACVPDKATILQVARVLV